MKIIIFLFILHMFLSGILNADNYALIDDNNVYIYRNSYNFSGEKNTQYDTLVITYPRNTVFTANSTQEAVSKTISRLSTLNFVFNIIKQNSSFLSQSIINIGLPGFATTSFGYTRQKGWGLYIRVDNPLFRPIFENHLNRFYPNYQTDYYFIEPNIIQRHSPGDCDF